MAQLNFDYRSVKDSLPLNDGKFYEVMVILCDTSISGGYGYYKGEYQNGFFFVDKGIYRQDKDFYCEWTQRKIIAWKPLELCTKEQIREFYAKAGIKEIEK